jgi:ABC-2 type transport system ATP-binding protein
MKSAVLEAKSVRKLYRSRVVLKDLSLSLRAGELATLLGPNGAGKTTFIRMVLGLSRPHGGELNVLGATPGSWAVRLRLGCTPQESDFPRHLTVSEVLSFVAGLYHDPLAVEEMLETFQLTNRSRQRVGTLSGGERRCLGLACAFVGRPALVVLDEPTVGLDAEVRRWAWRYVRGFVEAGGSVLLTTHHLEEAEALSDRIWVLNRGEIVTEGTPEQIRARLGWRRVRYRLNGKAEDLMAQDSDQVAREALRAGAVELEVMPVSLEEAFVEILRSSPCAPSV